MGGGGDGALGGAVVRAHANTGLRGSAGKRRRARPNRTGGERRQRNALRHQRIACPIQHSLKDFYGAAL